MPTKDFTQVYNSCKMYSCQIRTSRVNERQQKQQGHLISSQTDQYLSQQMKKGFKKNKLGKIINT